MDMVACVVVLVALVCAVTDVRKRKVYNVVTLPTMLAGLVYHSSASGVNGFIDSLQGLLFGIFILILPFLLGGTGAGDSKLLGALGAWLCVPSIVHVFIIAGVFAAFASAGVFVFHNTHILRHPMLALASLLSGVSPATSSGHERPLPRFVKKSVAMPFALLVAMGVGIVLFIDF